MSEPLPGPRSIEHRRGQSRGAFLLQVGEQTLGRLDYSLAGDAVIIEHTEVDESLRGQGAGRQLVGEAVVWAREVGRQVRPVCPYARRVIADTPQLRDVSG